MSTAGERLILAVGLGYLALLSWAIGNLSFDIWGALVLIPIYGVLGVALLRKMFAGPHGALAPIMGWGMLIKLGGALARYWVGFEAYSGGIDAQAYDDFANAAAGEVWAGDRSVLEVLPHGTGTEFVENFTAFAYTVSGGSQLAGFVTFSLLAYIGLAFFVKATVVAVPGMATRKYAWLCVLAPSLVYWPSSIGKEALMMLGLGVGTYGIALMLSRRSWLIALMVAVAGLGFAGLIRPHMTGIWIAAAVPALALAFVLGGRSKAIHAHPRRTGRLSIIVGLVVAAVALSVVATFAVRFLEPGTDEDAPTSLTEILEETQRRTSKTGSTFVPPSVSSPTSWPYAAVRTLTRPLPIEARGVAQLLSAAEIVAIAGVYVASWRRLRSIPMLVFTNPYVAFAVTATFLGGLAFASFANLGVLTRQKSLLFPLLLLPVCVPTRRANADRTARPATTVEPRERTAAWAPPADTRAVTDSEDALFDVWN